MAQFAIEDAPHRKLVVASRKDVAIGKTLDGLDSCVCVKSIGVGR